MSKPEDEKPATEIPLEDCARALNEGAFVSPCGAEGCQWDGFPEADDDDVEKEAE